jgi:hypothetical protein
MLRTKDVKALQQIPRCIGIVPVVTGVVDDDVIAIPLGAKTRIFDEIMAGKKHFEDGVAKGGIF